MKRFTVLLFLLMSLSGFAQRYGEVGLIGGGMYYLGDLNPGKQFMLTKPAFGGFIRHNFNERMAVRGAVMFGSVEGDDAVSKQDPLRNLNFESTITDFSGTIEVNFFDYFIGSMRHFVTPYMYGGASMFLFNPKGNVNGSLMELRPMHTEGQSKPYSKVGFAIPFGIGFKYSLNSFLGMSLDWGMRKTFTDYLDDVSTTYYMDLIGTSPGEVADPALEFASDPTRLHNAGMQRGDSAYDDWYSVVSVSISVRLNYLERERCLNIFY